MYHPVSLNPDSKYETNEIDILSIYQFKDSNPKNNTLFTEKKKKNRKLIATHHPLLKSLF